MITPSLVVKVISFCSFCFENYRFRLAFVHCFNIQSDSDGLLFYDTRLVEDMCIHAGDLQRSVAYGHRSLSETHLEYVVFPSSYSLDPDLSTDPPVD